ncbi:MAG: glutathione-dependent disulfide-bond oxidoreductase [Wenzhouxiangella sp.]
MTDQTYEPPRIWQWEKGNGGKFANINRPTAGAQHDTALPRGEHALQLYSLATPNGQKVTILLEELLALGIDSADYDAWVIDIGEGEQFGSDFVAANPNSKIPALVDYHSTPPQRVFESGAILLYLAEKYRHFLPTAPAARTESLNWLFWQMGSAPLLGGGFGHFYAYAPTKIKYAIDRYAMEAKRQLDVLDQALADREWIGGGDYSIADMAIWPWYGQLALGRLYEAAEFLQVEEYRHVQRWAKAIDQRPAVQRGIIVNKVWGDENRQLANRHSAADIDKVLAG